MNIAPAPAPAGFWKTWERNHEEPEKENLLSRFASGFEVVRQCVAVFVALNRHKLGRSNASSSAKALASRNCQLFYLRFRASLRDAFVLTLRGFYFLTPISYDFKRFLLRHLPIEHVTAVPRRARHTAVH
eukprot:g61786.t1